LLYWKISNRDLSDGTNIRNGQIMAAAHAAFSLKYILNLKTGVSLRRLRFSMEGFYNGKCL
jgi:hypothetical protein